MCMVNKMGMEKNSGMKFVAGGKKKYSVKMCPQFYLSTMYMNVDEYLKTYITNAKTRQFKIFSIYFTDELFAFSQLLKEKIGITSKHLIIEDTMQKSNSLPPP